VVFPSRGLFRDHFLDCMFIELVGFPPMVRAPVGLPGGPQAVAVNVRDHPGFAVNDF
jgi:hypothetical protein